MREVSEERFKGESIKDRRERATLEKTSERSK